MMNRIYLKTGNLNHVVEERTSGTMTEPYSCSFQVCSKIPLYVVSLFKRVQRRRWKGAEDKARWNQPWLKATRSSQSRISKPAKGLMSIVFFSKRKLWKKSLRYAEVSRMISLYHTCHRVSSSDYQNLVSWVF